jgi:hypothetical protein
MATKFFTTLAVALLGFVTTKAQAPFTGRVEYEFVFQEEAPREQPRMILEYRPRYMKLIAFAIKDTITGLYESETEMVIDYTSGKTYQLIHDVKKIVSRESTTTSLLPELTQLAGEQTTIAGARANLYQTKIDEFQSYKIWFADSISVSISDVLAKNSDFFIFGTGKLLLRVEPDTTSGKKNKREDVTINAVKITPLTFSDSSYQLPTGYTLTDEMALKELQDSILRAFKKVDSELTISNRLLEDSAKWVADEANSYVNKKPPSPKKPTKKPAKKPTNKPAAYRKQ